MDKPTKTGRDSWFLHARFHLGYVQTNLYEDNFCSVKKSNDPMVLEEEPSDPLPLTDIRESTPIYSCLQVNAFTLPNKEIEITNEEKPPPSPNAPPNPGKIIPTPINGDKEQEDTVVPPPISPEQDSVVLHPNLSAPDSVAPPRITPAPPNPV